MRSIVIFSNPIRHFTNGRNLSISQSPTRLKYISASAPNPIVFIRIHAHNFRNHKSQSHRFAAIYNTPCYSFNRRLSGFENDPLWIDEKWRRKITGIVIVHYDMVDVEKWNNIIICGWNSQPSDVMFMQNIHEIKISISNLLFRPNDTNVFLKLWSLLLTIRTIQKAEKMVESVNKWKLIEEPMTLCWDAFALLIA